MTPDNAVCTNNCTVTDVYAGQNNGVLTDPYIVADNCIAF